MMRNAWGVIGILNILSICLITGEDTRTLKMVHLVYRHGARSPMQFYPTNPNIKYWKDGPGRLTQIGMNMQFELGKFLKDRYITNTHFIDPMYLHDEVYIRSSDSERCLQSAESQLAGLYPPIKHQVWNPNLPWQPIPIHTIPMKKDSILVTPGAFCPRLSEKYVQMKNMQYKELERKKMEKHEDLPNYLTTHSGMNVSFGNMFLFTDVYLCEKAENLTSPAWLLSRLDELIDISTWFALHSYFAGDDEVGRLLGGSFLNLIINNMKQMSEGTKSTDLFKMNMFSGHDSSILALATALDIDITYPTFAACIMIELYTDESNNYYVEMQYRNDSSGTLYPLELKECQFSCPLQAFKSLTKNRVTDDVAKDCMVGVVDSSKESRKFPVEKLYLIIIGLLATSTFFLLSLVLWYRCKARRIKTTVSNLEDEMYLL